MHKLSYLLLFFFFATASGQATKRQLVWADEFNKPGKPDSSKWRYDLGTGENGWGNDELEYYTDRPENALVTNGVLQINAIREDYHDRKYTSARLLSHQKFSFRYGYVAVRARLPEGKGTWPAIWMLGSNFAEVGWPACGEIDIMEHRGNEPGKIFGTLHYPGHSGAEGNGHTTLVPDASTRFHLYSLEWSPSFIRICVDHRLYHTVPNNRQIPFNHNFFFILNLAMGGGFGGAVDPAFSKATMEVDYIRVYKLKGMDKSQKAKRKSR